MNEEVKETIRTAAETKSVLEILYQKIPDDTSAPMRQVEPYKLTEGTSGLMLRAFQIQPLPEGWKSFVIDKIAIARKLNQTFRPRSKVTAHTGEITMTLSAKQLFAPNIQDYRGLVESVLCDLVLTDEEVRKVITFQETVDVPSEIMRSIHAGVFASFLVSIVSDGYVSDTETHQILELSYGLHKLGWSVLDGIGTVGKKITPDDRKAYDRLGAKFTDFMYCKQCDCPITFTDKFCSQCGFEITRISPITPVVSPTPPPCKLTATVYCPYCGQSKPENSPCPDCGK